MDTRVDKCGKRGAMGQGPTCTEGSDVLVHLEADNGAVVINDICLSIPGTGHHLLMPIALQKARDQAVGVTSSCCAKSPRDGAWVKNEGAAHLALCAEQPAGKKTSLSFLLTSLLPSMATQPTGATVFPVSYGGSFSRWK